VNGRSLVNSKLWITSRFWKIKKTNSKIIRLRSNTHLFGDILSFFMIEKRINYFFALFFFVFFGLTIIFFVLVSTFI